MTKQEVDKADALMQSNKIIYTTDELYAIKSYGNDSKAEQLIIDSIPEKLRKGCKIEISNEKAEPSGNQRLKTMFKLRLNLKYRQDADATMKKHVNSDDDTININDSDKVVTVCYDGSKLDTITATTPRHVQENMELLISGLPGAMGSTETSISNESKQKNTASRQAGDKGAATDAHTLRANLLQKSLDIQEKIKQLTGSVKKKDK